MYSTIPPYRVGGEVRIFALPLQSSNKPLFKLYCKQRRLPTVTCLWTLALLLHVAMSKPANHILKARLSKICVHSVPCRFKITKKVKDQSHKRQFSTGFKIKTCICPIPESVTIIRGLLEDHFCLLMLRNLLRF